MIFGQSFGDPYGDTHAQAIFATIDLEDPGVRNLSWTPEHATGMVYHLMIDQYEFTRTTGTEVADVPQDARDHIQVIETSDQNELEDLTNVADSPLDSVKLTWTEVSGADRYEVNRSTTSGVYNDDPIVIVGAGETSYTYYDRDLEDDTYYYRLTAYDDAGNSVNSNEIYLTISAAPEPPTDLTLTLL